MNAPGLQLPGRASIVAPGLRQPGWSLPRPSMWTSTPANLRRHLSPDSRDDVLVARGHGCVGPSHDRHHRSGPDPPALPIDGQVHRFRSQRDQLLISRLYGHMLTDLDGSC